MRTEVCNLMEVFLSKITKKPSLQLVLGIFLGIILDECNQCARIIVHSF